jgi:hypothetical protein
MPFVVIFSLGLDKVNHEYNYMTMNNKCNHLHDYKIKIKNSWLPKNAIITHHNNFVEISFALLTNNKPSYLT